MGHYVASLDSPERKRVAVGDTRDGVRIASISLLGFSAPDVLFFVRDRTLTAQRFDLNRLEVTGEPIRVAEGVDQLGLTAAFAVSSGGTLIYWTGTKPSPSRPGFSAMAPRPAPWGSRTLHESRALSRRAAGGDRSIRFASGHLASRPCARHREPGDFGRALRVDASLVARRQEFRVRRGAGHAAEPVREGDRHGRSKRNACSGPCSRASRKAGRPMDASSRTSRSTRRPTPAISGWCRPPASESRPRFSKRRSTEGSARISPDGRWLAYSSNESGTPSVYVTRFPEAVGKWPVSPGGGRFPSLAA